MSDAPRSKMTIDRAGLVEIYDALASIKGNLSQVIHKFTAAAMRRQLSEFVDPILEMKTDADKLRPQAYFEERENLLREYATKDKDGRPLIAANSYVIDPTRSSEFETAAVALKEKHQESIDKFDDEVKRVNEFLRGDVEFSIPTCRLRLSWFNEQVDQDHLEALFPFIDDDVTDAPAPAKSAHAERAAKKAEKSKA